MLEKVEGKGKYAKYLIRKDKVKVPENLPEGDYVLSFRLKMSCSQAFH